ncbi:DUF4384 domain-containing protein, partial [Candidatus Magnetobacterium casense]
EISLPIGTTTGAIVPYDVAADSMNAEKIIASLIVGRTDLRPVIGELDKDRKLFVVFDSCFSGNAVRTVKNPKGIKKNTAIPGFTDTPSPPWSGSKDTGYPYRNTIYISASEDNTTARDLDDGSGTFDNKAHGALTNAIVKGLQGKADTNNDGVVTYEELHKYAKADTNDYAQTPQLLHPKDMAVNTPVFGKRGAAATAQGTVNRPSRQGIVSSKGALKVKLEFKGGDSQSSNLDSSLESLKGVKMVRNEKDYDLLITNDKGPYTLYISSGDKLYEAASAEDVVKRVERYVKVRELVTLSHQGQKFNVFLKIGGTKDKIVFRKGEVLDFTIKSEEDAYVVLLNVDAEGFVTVLVPQTGNELSSAQVSKGKSLEFKELGKIAPPFGSEFMKVFAFRG